MHGFRLLLQQLQHRIQLLLRQFLNQPGRCRNQLGQRKEEPTLVEPDALVSRFSPGSVSAQFHFIFEQFCHGAAQFLAVVDKEVLSSLPG